MCAQTRGLDELFEVTFILLWFDVSEIIYNLFQDPFQPFYKTRSSGVFTEAKFF